MGNKVYSGAIRKYVERWHEAGLQKNVYCYESLTVIVCFYIYEIM